MIVFTDRNPKWLNWIAPEQFNDYDLFRIVVFFVFHSPCPEQSFMCKTLEEYGWSAPWKKPYWLNCQLKQAASNYELIFPADRYTEMDTALEEANLKDNFPSDLFCERICIYDNQRNQFMSIFYHLRNAFAHCRLNMVDVNGECVFVIEDVQPNKKEEKVKVTARMILRKSTLLKWIDLIEGGEQEYNGKPVHG